MTPRLSTSITDRLPLPGVHGVARVVSAFVLASLVAACGPADSAPTPPSVQGTQALPPHTIQSPEALPPYDGAMAAINDPATQLVETGIVPSPLTLGQVVDAYNRVLTTANEESAKGSGGVVSVDLSPLDSTLTIVAPSSDYPGSTYRPKNAQSGVNEIGVTPQPHTPKLNNPSIDSFLRAYAGMIEEYNFGTNSGYSIVDKRDSALLVIPVGAPTSLLGDKTFWRHNTPAGRLVIFSPAPVTTSIDRGTPRGIAVGQALHMQSDYKPRLGQPPASFENLSPSDLFAAASPFVEITQALSVPSEKMGTSGAEALANSVGIFAYMKGAGYTYEQYSRVIDSMNQPGASPSVSITGFYKFPSDFWNKIGINGVPVI